MKNKIAKRILYVLTLSLLTVSAVLLLWLAGGCSNSGDITVTFDSNGGSHIESVTLNSGESLESIPSPQKTGAEFYAWYLNPELSLKLKNNYTFYADSTLFARYTPLGKAVVTFDTGSGEKLPDIVTDIGGTIAVPTAVFQGAMFAGWYYDNGYTRGYHKDDAITENITLYARFVTEDGEGIIDTLENVSPDFELLIVSPYTLNGNTFKDYIEYTDHANSGANLIFSATGTGTRIAAVGGFEAGGTYSFTLKTKQLKFADNTYYRPSGYSTGVTFTVAHTEIIEGTEKSDLIRINISEIDGLVNLERKSTAADILDETDIDKDMFGIYLTAAGKHSVAPGNIIMIASESGAESAFKILSRRELTPQNGSSVAAYEYFEAVVPDSDEVYDGLNYSVAAKINLNASEDDLNELNRLFYSSDVYKSTTNALMLALCDSSVVQNELAAANGGKPVEAAAMAEMLASTPSAVQTGFSTGKNGDYSTVALDFDVTVKVSDTMAIRLYFTADFGFNASAYTIKIGGTKYEKSYAYVASYFRFGISSVIEFKENGITREIDATEEVKQIFASANNLDDISAWLNSTGLFSNKLTYKNIASIALTDAQINIKNIVSVKFELTLEVGVAFQAAINFDYYHTSSIAIGYVNGYFDENNKFHHYAVEKIFTSNVARTEELSLDYLGSTGISVGLKLKVTLGPTCLLDFVNVYLYGEIGFKVELRGLASYRKSVAFVDGTEYDTSLSAGGLNLAVKLYVKGGLGLTVGFSLNWEPVNVEVVLYETSLKDCWMDFSNHDNNEAAVRNRQFNLLTDETTRPMFELVGLDFLVDGVTSKKGYTSAANYEFGQTKNAARSPYITVAANGDITIAADCPDGERISIRCVVSGTSPYNYLESDGKIYKDFTLIYFSDPSVDTTRTHRLSYYYESGVLYKEYTVYHNQYAYIPVTPIMSNIHPVYGSHTEVDAANPWTDGGGNVVTPSRITADTEYYLNIVEKKFDLKVYADIVTENEDGTLSVTEKVWVGTENREYFAPVSDEEKQKYLAYDGLPDKVTGHTLSLVQGYVSTYNYLLVSTQYMVYKVKIESDFGMLPKISSSNYKAYSMIENLPAFKSGDTFTRSVNGIDAVYVFKGWAVSIDGGAEVLYAGDIPKSLLQVLGTTRFRAVWQSSTCKSEFYRYGTLYATTYGVVGDVPTLPDGFSKDADITALLGYDPARMTVTYEGVTAYDGAYEPTYNLAPYTNDDCVRKYIIVADIDYMVHTAVFKNGGVEVEKVSGKDSLAAGATYTAPSLPSYTEGGKTYRLAEWTATYTDENGIDCTLSVLPGEKLQLTRNITYFADWFGYDITYQATVNDAASGFSKTYTGTHGSELTHSRIEGDLKSYTNNSNVKYTITAIYGGSPLAFPYTFGTLQAAGTELLHINVTITAEITDTYCLITLDAGDGMLCRDDATLHSQTAFYTWQSDFEENFFNCTSEYTPQKPEDEYYTYAFAGWTPAVPVFLPGIYSYKLTANYTAIRKTYAITFYAYSFLDDSIRDTFITDAGSSESVQFTVNCGDSFDMSELPTRTNGATLRIVDMYRFDRDSYWMFYLPYGSSVITPGGNWEYYMEFEDIADEPMYALFNSDAPIGQMLSANTIDYSQNPGYFYYGTSGQTTQIALAGKIGDPIRPPDTVPVRPGWTFVEWQDEKGNSLLPDATYPAPIGAIYTVSYYAHYEQQSAGKFTITYDAGEGYFYQTEVVTSGEWLALKVVSRQKQIIIPDMFYGQQLAPIVGFDPGTIYNADNVPELYLCLYGEFEPGDMLSDDMNTYGKVFSHFIGNAENSTSVVTKDDTYTAVFATPIFDEDEFVTKLTQNPDGDYVLMDDLSFGYHNDIAETATIIDTTFIGTLNGNGFKIYYLAEPETDFALFSAVNGNVRDLVVQARIVLDDTTAHLSIGGLALSLGENAYIERVTMIFERVALTFNSHRVKFGGIAVTNGGTVRDCKAEFLLLDAIALGGTASLTWGGLVCENNGVIERSLVQNWLTVEFTSSGTLCLGGLASENRGRINSCAAYVFTLTIRGVNTGNITAGGLIAKNYGAATNIYAMNCIMNTEALEGGMNVISKTCPQNYSSLSAITTAAANRYLLETLIGLSMENWQFENELRPMSVLPYRLILDENTVYNAADIYTYLFLHQGG